MIVLYYLAAMNRKALAVGGIAALAFAGMQYREFILFRDNLGFGIKAVKIASLNANSVTLKFNLVVTNPRPFAVRAQGVDIQISTQGKRVGIATRSVPFEIKPLSVTTIPATFKIPYNGAIPAIVQLFENLTDNNGMPLKAAGFIRFGLFDAPFSTNFNLL